jgi:hypothetical protein
MKRYIPLIATLIAAGLGTAVAAYTDGVITNAEKVNIAISIVGAGGVFTAPNIPGATYVKFAISMISPVLAFLASAITDGVSTSEWLQIGVIALGPIVVLAAPSPVTQAMSAKDLPKTS